MIMRIFQSSQRPLSADYTTLWNALIAMTRPHFTLRKDHLPPTISHLTHWMLIERLNKNMKEKLCLNLALTHLFQCNTKLIEYIRRDCFLKLNSNTKSKVKLSQFTLCWQHICLEKFVFGPRGQKCSSLDLRDLQTGNFNPSQYYNLVIWVKYHGRFSRT